MLNNINHFHFRSFPDKTNDFTFFRFPETFILGNFRHFLGIFKELQILKKYCTVTFKPKNQYLKRGIHKPHKETIRLLPLPQQSTSLVFTCILEI